MNQTALHRLQASKELKKPHTADQQNLFELRLATNLPILKELFFGLYPEAQHKNSFEKLIRLTHKLFRERPQELRLQDLRRLSDGNWHQSEKMVGMQLYVDRFNKDLPGLQAKLPYFEHFGINFLHLMPLTTRPKGENDGGYAVNSYTEVAKNFGSKEDLLSLTKELRSRNMFLMLDFVVNHTSNEFPWAKKAIKGSEKYQDYYYTYPDRTVPDAFELSLPEIFPETSPGNFTYVEEMGRWVMTVFNHYQWDLNYTNPEVFMGMFVNLMNKVNMGVDVVRFDALAFLWKKMGTNSQNLPEAHTLISLFRMCLQIVAPGVILLAEAIVAPSDIIAYFGQGRMEGNECEMAYNATLMALLWNSIATAKTTLLYRTLENLPEKPKDVTWITYLRCHDDIGLGFEDQYIYDIGWDAREHRKFLLDYYCQKLDWSPAMGYVFMYNEKTGDARITGSAASLLGLEKALKNDDRGLLDQATDKIILSHGIILSFGGIPMIYAGDEIGTLNDYSYLNDPHKQEDSRWVNRPFQNWRVIKTLHKKESHQSRIFNALRRLIAIRKKTEAFADRGNFILHDVSNPHLLMYERTHDSIAGVLVLCNFDTKPQVINSGRLDQLGYLKNSQLKDLISGKQIRLSSGLLELLPYQILWLVRT